MLKSPMRICGRSGLGRVEVYCRTAAALRHCSTGSMGWCVTKTQTLARAVT